MTHAPRLALLLFLLVGCGGEDASASARTVEAPQETSRAPGPPDTLVVSSDPALRAAVEELLPEIARRSGLELREPVRVERRSRDELERYLRAKLDEELPPDEEARLVRAYQLLGMIPEEVDLRALLLAVYTEQVAGFYDADSTALFVLDDQPPATMGPLLVHELVHAVQDQAAPLDSLTHKDRGNDRQVAAQAAIEGHATLVMLEQMMEQLQGREVDLADVPDFSAQLRPALEAMRSQYPALSSAPRVIQESVLFPYLEGAGFVQALWQARGGRPAPFGEDLPHSTEQVMHPDRFVDGRDEPTEVTVDLDGANVLMTDGMGELETRIFLEELTGASLGPEPLGWDGDRYVLTGDGAGSGLVWVAVWDDADARDGFVRSARPRLGSLRAGATLESVEVEGRPVTVLRVGDAPQRVRVELGVLSR